MLTTRLSDSTRRLLIKMATNNDLSFLPSSIVDALNHENTDNKALAMLVAIFLQARQLNDGYILQLMQQSKTEGMDFGNTTRIRTIPGEEIVVKRADSANTTSDINERFREWLGDFNSLISQLSLAAQQQAQAFAQIGAHHLHQIKAALTESGYDDEKADELAKNIISDHEQTVDNAPVKAVAGETASTARPLPPSGTVSVAPEVKASINRHVRDGVTATKISDTLTVYTQARTNHQKAVHQFFESHSTSLERLLRELLEMKPQLSRGQVQDLQTAFGSFTRLFVLQPSVSMRTGRSMGEDSSLDATLENFIQRQLGSGR